VKWAPAYRWNARLFREFIAIRTALHAPEQVVRQSGVDGWPPKSVRHLRSLDAIVGTPGPAQSVLVRFVEPGTESPRAVAKVMVSREPHAAERIAAESKAIQDPALDGLVPRHWEAGVIDGHHYLVTEFVTGPSITPGHRGMMAAMDTLAFQTNSTEIVEIKEHPWVLRTLERIPWLKPDRLVGRFPVTRTHGDFAPWNILVRPRKKLVLIDWEFSEADGVAGVDLAHFLLVTQHLWKHRDALSTTQIAVNELQRVGGYTVDEARTLMALAAGSLLLRQCERVFYKRNDFFRDIIRHAGVC
jgi:hypothetical protein